MIRFSFSLSGHMVTSSAAFSSAAFSSAAFSSAAFSFAQEIAAAVDGLLHGLLRVESPRERNV